MNTSLVLNGKQNDTALEEVDSFEPQTITLSALESITRAEIDKQISTAKHYPRSIKKFLRDAETMATIDEDTAASCFYKLQRGKGVYAKTIEGPSVRLAEICASAWHNLRNAANITEIGDTFLVARGMAHDLETNVAYATETRRRITYSDGGKYSDDMIITTANAACSIVLRNAIFRVIPRSYVDSIMEKAKQVAIGNAKTLGERRQKAVEYFLKMGLTEQRVFNGLEVNGMEEITLEKLELLTGLKTAIKEGHTSLDEAFPLVTVTKPLLEEGSKQSETRLFE